jgi:hypothetical protein
MSSCANCTLLFEKRGDGKGYKRHSVGARLSGDISIRVPLTPRRKLCPICSQLLGKIHNLEQSKSMFLERTSGHSFIEKRTRTPTTTPRSIKRPRVVSSSKVTPTICTPRVRVCSGSKVTPQKRTPTKQPNIKLKMAATSLLQYQYKRAMKLLFNSTKGCRRALVNEIALAVFRDMSTLLNTHDFPLAAKGNLNNMNTFSWSSILDTVVEETPLLAAVVTALVCRKKTALG